MSLLLCLISFNELFFSLCVCVCVCPFFLREYDEKKKPKKREWPFSLVWETERRRKKRIGPGLICQAAWTAGQIFIYGGRWTCMWWFKGEEQVKKEEKRKKEEVLLRTLLFFSFTYMCFKWFYRSFPNGDKDIIFDVFSFLRKWKDGEENAGNLCGARHRSFSYLECWLYNHR